MECASTNIIHGSPVTNRDAFIDSAPGILQWYG